MLLSGVDNPDSIQVVKGSMFNEIVLNCILQRYSAYAWRERQDRNLFPWTPLTLVDKIAI